MDRRHSLIRTYRRHVLPDGNPSPVVPHRSICAEAGHFCLDGTVKQTYPIGILFSTTGPYALLGRDALDGAVMALSEFNEDPTSTVELVPLIGDPGGVTDRYPTISDDLIRAGARHIVGGITSWSRKEIIPVADRRHALLWYPCPYEGYESSDSVIYVGACPNQHIVPLFAHVVPRYGGRVFLVGSNYIWGWETNRIAIKLLADHGGTVLGERYLPLGSEDVDRIIREIAEARPDFILNTLIGPSSYAFLKVYAELGRADRNFLPARRPVVSCNLAEAELDEIGDAGVGNLNTAVYFECLETPENRDFLSRVRRRYGPERRVSAFFVCAFMATRILAEAIQATGTDQPELIVPFVSSRSFASPMGPLRISSRTRHASFVPLLASIAPYNRFSLIDRATKAIEPDPYLSEYRPGDGSTDRARRRSGPPDLRIVRS
jgi:ABC-type branched-subunit amino acid transport system substrate-binding protein